MTKDQLLRELERHPHGVSLLTDAEMGLFKELMRYGFTAKDALVATRCNPRSNLVQAVRDAVAILRSKGDNRDQVIEMLVRALRESEDAFR